MLTSALGLNSLLHLGMHHLILEILVKNDEILSLCHILILPLNGLSYTQNYSYDINGI